METIGYIEVIFKGEDRHKNWETVLKVAEEKAAELGGETHSDVDDYEEET